MMHVSNSDNAIRDAALELAAHGLRVHPVRGKIPYLDGWQNEASTDENRILEFWPDGSRDNVGVVLGPSSNIIDIECDSPQAEQYFAEVFGEDAPICPTYKASRGNHRLFKFTPDLPPIIAAKGVAKPHRNGEEIGLEIRHGFGAAMQSVFPPSIHPSGVPYQWLPNCSLDDIDPPEIPRHVLDRFAADMPGAKVNGKASKTVAAYRGAVNGVSEGGRHQAAVSYAGEILRTCSIDDPVKVEIGRHQLHGWNQTNSPPLPEQEIDQVFDDILAKESERRATLQLAEDGFIHPELLCTDTANGKRFHALHGDNVKYVAKQKKFIIFRGTHWEYVEDSAIHGLAKEVSDEIIRESLAVQGEDRDQLLKWAKTSASDRRIEAAVKLFKSEPGVTISTSQLDADPWKFNCLNCTIDLQTGNALPHDQNDLITKLCPTNYLPDARCDMWDDSLRKIFNAGEESELLDFFQRLSGYSLAGVVIEQILAIWHGHGSNGKSFVIETIGGVIGPDYFCKAPRDFLTATKGDRHPTELANLFGKRLCVATETERGARLSEALVKELVGSDSITARRMREDFWTFFPTHQLIIVTNYKPNVKGSDHGIWRRIVLIPFTEKFWNPAAGEAGPEDRMQDKDLPEKIKAEHDGILAWMVRGCLDWHTNGLQIPQCVRAATEEYRESQDTIRHFIDECTTPLTGTKSPAGAMYDAYSRWCEDNGCHAMSSANFKDALTERGLVYHRDKKLRGWMDVALVVSTEAAAANERVW